MNADLIQNLALFCQLLRQSGLRIGPGESLDGVQALSHLDVTQRDQVFLGLRSVLVKRREDYPVFEAAFRIFFDGEVPGKAETMGEGGTEGDDAGGGFSPQEALLQRDLGTLDATGQAEAAQAARLLARRLSFRLARRRRPTRRGKRISLRATAREAARHGGRALILMHSRPRKKPANLVLLLDVSGSMELYSRVLLQFIHALQSGLPRTQSFCFATRLCRVSAELQEQAFTAAVHRAREKVEGWGGGTRIGACLTQFSREWVPVKGTVVIILSDGLDTGEPDLVTNAMAQIRRRARKVLWLNPLAGDSRYQPLARAMVAALPHLDLLAPGHNVASLMALERHLTGGSS